MTHRFPSAPVVKHAQILGIMHEVSGLKCSHDVILSVVFYIHDVLCTVHDILCQTKTKLNVCKMKALLYWGDPYPSPPSKVSMDLIVKKYNMKAMLFPDARIFLRDTIVGHLAELGDAASLRADQKDRKTIKLEDFEAHPTLLPTVRMSLSETRTLPTHPARSAHALRRSRDNGGKFVTRPVDGVLTFEDIEILFDATR